MAKTVSEKKISEKKVVEEAPAKKSDAEYVTLNFKGLSLPWAIFLSVLVFTAGIGSAVYFGLKERAPATTATTGTTGTVTPTTDTYAASEFATVSLPFTKGPQVGDPNAKVTIVEFSDLVCPYCKQFHDQSYGTIYNNYIKTGKVSMIYKYYPLSFHEPASSIAAEASVCVDKLYGDAKMYAFHDLFFANVNSLTQNAYDSNNNPLINIKNTPFYALFNTLGVDAAKIKTCMTSKDTADYLASDMAELTKFQTDIVGKGLSQGIGTPTFVVGIVKDGVLTGRLIEGAYPIVAFQNVITEQLAK